MTTLSLVLSWCVVLFILFVSLSLFTNLLPGFVLDGSPLLLYIFAFLPLIGLIFGIVSLVANIKQRRKSVYWLALTSSCINGLFCILLIVLYLNELRVQTAVKTNERRFELVDVELIDAVMLSHLDKAAAIIKANPEIANHCKDYDGGSLLGLAAANGNIQMASLLLANKSEINTKDFYGRTPLHNSALIGKNDMVNLLLTHGANPNVKDQGGLTPLILAVREGHENTVGLLLANKADANANDNQGWTPLHWAAREGYKEVAKLLITHSANINAKTKEGRTSLQVAEFMGHKEVAEFLRQHCGQE